MIHLTFFLYLIALSCGVSAITIALIYHQLYKKEVILHFAGMIGVVALLLMSKMILLYIDLTGISHAVNFSLIARIIEKCGYGAALFFGPHFLINLVGAQLNQRQRLFILLIGLVYLLLSAVEMTIPSETLREKIRLFGAMPILFGMFILCAGFGATYLNKLANKTLNRYLILFFGLALFVLPFSAYQYLTQKPYLPDYLEHPLSFLLITVLSIIFGVRYFNRPAFLEQNLLSDYFKKSFSITDREGEIILMVVQGLANGAIAEKLFISPRTVESHLYNIFQKTGIKNRTQLVNLLQSNRGECPAVS